MKRILGLLGLGIVVSIAVLWVRQTQFRYPAGKPSHGLHVVRDEYGVPTVTAVDHVGLFEAQGYATAADRMFQMDWSRRQLLGQTAEVLGQRTIVQDFQTRALGLERCATALYAQLNDDERNACEAYARGVNLWLSRNTGKLPIEFRRLGYRPRPWRGIDCLVVWRGMALTLGDLTDDLVAERTRAVGSNGWAVAGSRTTSGHPILAGDPHLEQSVPSALYEVRFAWDGGGALGWSIPGVPGLAMGRTRGVAFTATAFSGDESDVFTFPVDAKNPKRYQTRDGWKQAVSERPVVWLRLAGPLAIPIFWQAIEQTPWGPVIGRKEGRLRTLCWEGAKPLPGEGLIPVGTIDILSVAEARTLLHRHGLPDINVIAADTSGAIAHFRVARLPRRVEHRTPRDGLDSTLAWNGVHDFDELPHELNPTCGFVASGNGPPPATGFYLGFDYLLPREARIRERLGSRIDWSVESVHDLQKDHVSEPGRDETAKRLAALGVDSLSAAARAVIPILGRYDGRAELDSTGVTIFRAWQACGGGAAALNAAVGWLSRRLGPDPAGWRWSRVHQARIAHALDVVDSTWSVPPFPRAGDRATIDVAGYAKFDTSAAIPARATHGPALRWITDLSPGGGTWGVTLCGESGVEGDPHRLDQLDLWRTGELRKIPAPGSMPDRISSDEWITPRTE